MVVEEAISFCLSWALDDAFSFMTENQPFGYAFDLSDSILKHLAYARPPRVESTPIGYRIPG